MLKATTVHQELRVLPPHVECGGAQEVPLCESMRGRRVSGESRWAVPAALCGLVGATENRVRGSGVPANVIRIVTETGLRIYKELTPMKKEQLDLENRTVWIPDSKTPNGVAEVPLTDIAVEAFRNQLAISGPGAYLFPSERECQRASEDVQDRLARDVAAGEVSVLSHLRSPLHVRHAAQRRRRRGRVGDAVAPAGRREGVQEVLADEAADETRGAGKAEPASERKRPGFWHSTGPD